jgi:hypothetical protein
MFHQIGLGTLVATIGLMVLIDPGVTYAQVEGAVQYPPLSIGEDAQPPPPARMVPRIVSPRRSELAADASSLPPPNTDYRIYRDPDRFPIEPAPLSGAWPAPPLTGNRND